MKHLLLISMLLAGSQLHAQPDAWETYYEHSGKTETPRYDETIEYCRRMQDNSPMVHIFSFGKSARGLDLPAVVVDAQGLTDPAAIHAAGKVLLMIQACIHSGECEGKDAGMMLIRDIVILNRFPGILDHVSILFIPIFNVDGHERFNAYNRINQNGPKEMGWRVTANNLNLNRDYLKADSPEMKAWLMLFNTWMPDFFIDTHTTDGADYQYVMTYLMETLGDMDPGLTQWSKNSFLKPWTTRLDNVGLTVFPYIEFRRWHDPESGIGVTVGPPMLSQVYTSLRNRPGLLLETHMLKPYDQRVTATYEALKAAMEVLGVNNSELRNLVRKADGSTAAEEFRESVFPLRFALTSDSTMVDFLGFGYSKVKSDVTGEYYYQYNTKKTTLTIPYFNTNKPVESTLLPEAYIIPAEWKEVGERLAMHGISVQKLKKDTVLPITTWKFTSAKWQSAPYEGRHPLTSFECKDVSLTRDFAAGSYLVDMNQPGARIIAHLLEPKGNGSLLYWGFFDPVFEQKEYAEDYVMAPIADKMLAKSDSLRADFEKKKKADTAFAKDPNAILNWFYSKTPYWDDHKNVFPVGRIYDRGVVDGLIKD